MAEVLRVQRTGDILVACVAPVVFVVFAVLSFAWSGDLEGPVLSRIIGAVFAAVAVATPFLIRWEFRLMDGVAAELRSRLPE